MRNPIHKRLANLVTWQQHIFMACLCERMYPNFYFYCQLHDGKKDAQTYRNILDLVWESFTVKNARINFDNQLEKLENIIPSLTNIENYAIFPAIDACEALANMLHTLIGGESLEQAIKLSQLSLKTIVELLESQQGRELTEVEIKEDKQIEQELDIQWQIYRVLKESESYDVSMILGLKGELKAEGISNIGIQMQK